MPKKKGSKSKTVQKVSVGQKVLIAVGLVAGLGAIAAGAGSFDYERAQRKRAYYKEQQLKKTMQKTSQNKTAQTVQTAQKKLAYKRVYPGMLIKSPQLSTLYYVAEDFKKHALPNEDVLTSWYKVKGGGFGNSITWIPLDQMNKIKVGENVRIRPGYRPVKITSDPGVYTISKGGVLHQIVTEALAVQLYGPKWALKVVDVPDAFFMNYTIGDPIVSKNSEFAPAKQLIATPTIDHDLGLK